MPRNISGEFGEAEILEKGGRSYDGGGVWKMR